MDFELDQDQQMLAKTVGDFAKNESPVARFRQFRDDDTGYDPAAWRKMGELGWMGVPFPESAGGFGGSFTDCALVLENLATTLVPEPYLASVVLGGMTLARAGDVAQHETYLTPMIEGETTLALAYSEAQSRYDVSAVATTAASVGGGYSLRGEKVWVLNGHRADHLIVSAKAPGGVTLFVVPRDAEGMTVKVAKTIDGRNAAFIRLEDVTVADAARLGEEGSGAAVLDRTMDYAAAAAVAEGVGIAATMLQMTVDYLGTREQFGVKIGSFQALQHRAVDMYAETELLRSISMAAMVRADDDDASARRGDISAAKYQLATGGIWVAQQALQLHGGIGVTDEHDIGLYFKRMYALNALFGDEEHHVARFASDPAFVEYAV
jgi:alkylation response protein AidB-like acyl-CoA dehydrogenase